MKLKMKMKILENKNVKIDVEMKMKMRNEIETVYGMRQAEEGGVGGLIDTNAQRFCSPRRVRLAASVTGVGLKWHGEAAYRICIVSVAKVVRCSPLCYFGLLRSFVLFPFPWGHRASRCGAG